jgi:hypothetical protein
MMIVTMLIAAAAILLLWVSGYLFGVRRGAEARAELHRRLQSEGAAATDPRALSEMVKQAVASAQKPGELPAILADPPRGFARRGELPSLLAQVADEANMSQIVLSDDAGLPIAHAGDNDLSETLAATSSVFLSYIDRLKSAGLPHPVGAVVHDSQSQRLLFRVFGGGPDRFVLTAVTRGHRLEPLSLDPVVGRIESLLAKPNV